MGIFNKLRSLFSKGQDKDAIPASDFDQEQEQFEPQTAETDPEYLQTIDSAASQTSQHPFVPQDERDYQYEPAADGGVIITKYLGNMRIEGYYSPLRVKEREHTGHPRP